MEIKTTDIWSSDFKKITNINSWETTVLGARDSSDNPILEPGKIVESRLFANFWSKVFVNEIQLIGGNKRITVTSLKNQNWQAYKYIRTSKFAKEGTYCDFKPGYFAYPYCVKVNKLNEIFVLDLQHCCIQVFNILGVFQRMINNETLKNNLLRLPLGFDLFEEKVVIADYSNGLFIISEKTAKIIHIKEQFLSDVCIGKGKIYAIRKRMYLGYDIPFSGDEYIAIFDTQGVFLSWIDITLNVNHKLISKICCYDQQNDLLLLTNDNSYVDVVKDNKIVQTIKFWPTSGYISGIYLKDTTLFVHNSYNMSVLVFEWNGQTLSLTPKQIIFLPKSNFADVISVAYAQDRVIVTQPNDSIVHITQVNRAKITFLCLLCIE